MIVQDISKPVKLLCLERGIKFVDFLERLERVCKGMSKVVFEPTDHVMNNCTVEYFQTWYNTGFFQLSDNTVYKWNNQSLSFVKSIPNYRGPARKFPRVCYNDGAYFVTEDGHFLIDSHAGIWDNQNQPDVPNIKKIIRVTELWIVLDNNDTLYVHEEGKAIYEEGIWGTTQIPAKHTVVHNPFPGLVSIADTLGPPDGHVIPINIAWAIYNENGNMTRRKIDLETMSVMEETEALQMVYLCDSGRMTKNARNGKKFIKECE